MHKARQLKEVEKERKGADVSVKDLAKFDPDDFDIHEDAFLNLLARTVGANKEPLRYVVREQNAPAEFADDFERRLYQLPLTGAAFEEDNRKVYHLLKAFLIDTPGWAWIEHYNATEHGRGAFWAWADHYNGQGELSKRTQMAKATLQSLHYKNEWSMSFERYSELLTKVFVSLDKDLDEALSNQQKIEKLLKGINTPDTELTASKAVIMLNYPYDFTRACSYFSQQVSRLHGRAQLENKKYRKRRISEVRTRGGHGQGGCGRYERGGRRSGRGGRGGRGGRDQVVINGIDVSDPTRSFTNDEWSKLARNGGQAFVMQARERMAGRGGRAGGRDGGHDGGRGRGGQRNASET